MIPISIPGQPHSYTITFHAGFASLFTALNSAIGKRNVVYITDENVFEKTGFFSSLPKEKICILPAGEEHKTWGSIEKILDFCFASNLDRSSVLVAVGGGVVGDMAGFAASIFMRGIPCIQVPTTLLSMVDSSVGGKTGIDSEYGKNLIGSFHQPEAVLCCQQFLYTLEKIEIQNGLCEMIKHGIIASPQHFKNIYSFAEQHSKSFSQISITNHVIDDVFLLIPESVSIKKEVVEKDEKESGVRGFLNLGHTYGHAIELLSDFTVPHGIAVAKGIWCAVQESIKRGLIQDENTEEKIRNIFSLLSIDLNTLFAKDEIYEAMRHDKKKQDGKIRLILIRTIGEVEYAFA